MVTLPPISRLGAVCWTLHLLREPAARVYDLIRKGGNGDVVLVKFFGYFLASGVVLTSLLMLVLGAKWQEIEAAAYGSKRRPLWFVLVSVLLIGVYVAALVDFFSADKTWATWVLALVIPLGWLVKGAMVVFNPSGRQTVSSISGGQAWCKVALARLPVAVVLLVLA